MPDSDADRQRRSRAHRRGDHRYCIEGKCDALRSSAPLYEPDDDMVTTTDAMKAWCSVLDLPPSDPRRPIVSAALRLAQAVDRNEAMPQSARELRVLVEWVADFEDRANKLDEVRARRAQRRLALILNEHAS